MRLRLYPDPAEELTAFPGPPIAGFCGRERDAEGKARKGGDWAMTWWKVASWR